MRDVADMAGDGVHRIAYMCCKVQTMLATGKPIAFDYRKREPARGINCFRGDREYWMKQVQRLKVAMGITDPMPKAYHRRHPYEQHSRNIEIMLGLADQVPTVKLATKYELSTQRIEASARRIAAVGKHLAETGRAAAPGNLVSLTFIRGNPDLIKSYVPALKRHYNLED